MSLAAFSCAVKIVTQRSPTPSGDTAQNRFAELDDFGESGCKIGALSAENKKHHNKGV